MSNRNLKFVRVGLPFFAIVLGGAYGLHFFQEVRFDFRKIKQQDANLDTLRTDLSKTFTRKLPILILTTGRTSVVLAKPKTSPNTNASRNNNRKPTENIEPSDLLPNVPVGHQFDLPTDNPPEPDNASIRAERGSPTPSSVTVDAPSLHDRNLSLSGAQVSDPFSGDIPEVPVPSSSALSISSQALSDPAPVHAGGFLNPQQVSSSSHPVDPQEPNEVNPEFLAQLLDLGFDEFTARLALKRTNNSGVEQAVAWIVERSNLSDLEEDSSSSDEEGDVEMGGSLSTGGRTHKMVLVANMSLKMGTGKLAAQVGHATLGVYRQAMNSEDGSSAINEWTRHGQVKIVVKGQSTEQLMDLCKAAKDAGCYYYLVQDAGYTQIPAGSRTVLGVFGTVEQVDSVTGGLKLL
ncbi:unnamed protein product [Caenorhabditis auriculariae]|uniref:peptidyl-tRNA hydrolase n=1 Tax=Caenorhabditis auriculariae TaxID=2777116 RepID=A0A8S1HD94_9PELO|nr:unnamed protein product [Caenorhabditis auriculariae]